MTEKEFNETSFKKGMKVENMGKEYFVFAVDFMENLLMIGEDYNEDTFWVRCENCKTSWNDNYNQALKNRK